MLCSRFLERMRCLPKSSNEAGCTHGCFQDVFQIQQFSGWYRVVSCIFQHQLNQPFHAGSQPVSPLLLPPLHLAATPASCSSDRPSCAKLPVTQVSSPGTKAKRAKSCWLLSNTHCQLQPIKNQPKPNQRTRSNRPPDAAKAKRPEPPSASPAAQVRPPPPLRPPSVTHGADSTALLLPGHAPTAATPLPFVRARPSQSFARHGAACPPQPRSPHISFSR